MSSDDDSKALFIETQQVRQKWTLRLTVEISSLVVLILIISVLRQNGDIITDLIILIAASIIIVALLLYLLWHVRLDTVIDLEGLTYQFAPFHRTPRNITWDKVSVAVVRQYRPIVEYGGRGFRWGFAGLAYNVSGNMGLQLVLQNRRRILIGTQKPEELERVVLLLQKNGRIPIGGESKKDLY